VTPGAPLPAIRAKCEETLLALQRDPQRFEALARECSNCPSGANGGSLGQLGRGEVVPEFAAAVFDPRRTGLLPAPVRTRYGFHIVFVDHRVPGQVVPFEAVRERIAAELRERVQERALHQYVQVLAGRAGIEIPGLDSAHTPLVQ
jgi:peptidyl-prolyl cis-trans isomerase C